MSNSTHLLLVVFLVYLLLSTVKSHQAQDTGDYLQHMVYLSWYCAHNRFSKKKKEKKTLSGKKCSVVENSHAQEESAPP